MRMLFPATLALLLAGCSTAPTLPAIKTFSDAVTTTTVAVDLRYEQDDIATKRQNDIDRLIVENKLPLNVDCPAPIGLSVALDDPGLGDFTKHCALNAFDLSSGRPVPTKTPTPDGTESADAYNARRLAHALGDYAASLKALAESDGPRQLAPAFESAAGSVLNLIGTAQASFGGQGLDAAQQRLAGAGTSLLGGVLTEAYETRRFKLMRRIVEVADPTVELSARAVAGWFRIADGSNPRELYEALDAAVADQQRAIIAVNDGTGDAAAAVTATQAARIAYQNVVNAETRSSWRTHLAIARAHRGILKSLQDAGDLSALAAANDRIADLAGKAKAFYEALRPQP